MASKDGVIMGMHQEVDFKNAAAYLIAKRMFNLYPRALRMNPGLGPELFVENWMRSYLADSTDEFEDDAVRYFNNLMLKKTQK